MDSLDTVYCRQAVEAPLGQTYVEVPCCRCGKFILPRTPLVCDACEAEKTDLSVGVAKNLELSYCKTCERYNHQGHWVSAGWESRQMGAILLSKISGLKGMSIIETRFLFTEFHSKRMRFEITVQRDRTGSDPIRQAFVVFCNVRWTQCEHCQQAFTPHTWCALVQIRQRVPNKTVSRYVEQQVLKSKFTNLIGRVRQMPEGLDVEFAKANSAEAFAQFVQTLVPCRQSGSRQLVTHDANNNRYKFKYSTCLEICELARGDLVKIPKETIYSGLPDIMLVLKVTINKIALVDPNTARVHFVSVMNYWRYPLQVIASSIHGKSLICSDVESVTRVEKPKKNKKITKAKAQKKKAKEEAEAWSAQEARVERIIKKCEERYLASESSKILRNKKKQDIKCNYSSTSSVRQRSVIPSDNESVISDAYSTASWCPTVRTCMDGAEVMRRKLVNDDQYNLVTFMDPESGVEYDPVPVYNGVSMNIGLEYDCYVVKSTNRLNGEEEISLPPVICFRRSRKTSRTAGQAFTEIGSQASVCSVGLLYDCDIEKEKIAKAKSLAELKSQNQDSDEEKNTEDEKECEKTEEDGENQICCDVSSDEENFCITDSDVSE